MRDTCQRRSREYDLLFYSDCIIAAAIETFVRETAEVADRGETMLNEPVKEFKHPRAAQCDHAADRHTDTQLEVRNVFFDRLTTGLWPENQLKFVDCTLKQFLVLGCIANTNIKANFFQLGPA
jgi:hypothetical protein